MKRKIMMWWTIRIFAMISVIFATFTMTFFLMHTVKGDPFSATIEDLPNDVRQRYIAQYGLDKPVVEQYLIFLRKLIMQGDFGVSLRNHTSTVKDIIVGGMPASVLVGCLSLVLGTILGYLLGLWGAYSNSKYIKEMVSSISLLGISIPIYILAPILQRELAVKRGFLPVSGWGTINHIVLPTICMLPMTVATILKYTKNSIEQVRRTNYYIAAKQRGFSEFLIFRKHVFRNSAPPIVTVLISSMSAVFSGSFIVEKIFAVPGIGRQFVNAISARDYTIIIGLNVVFTGVYVSFMLFGDLLQGIVNPQFRNNLF